MPKCLIFDSDNENSDNDDSLDYSNYREVSLNDIKSNLNRKTSQWCKQYTNIKITSEIKNKKSFYSCTIFDITNNGESFKCKCLDNGESINTKTLYDMYGCIELGKYGIEFLVEHFVEKHHSISKLEELKSSCNKLGYFNNKKLLDYNNLNHITILSKQGTQGYCDFIEHLKIPFNIKLINVCLEGADTKKDILKAMSKVPRNSDLIIIMRGGGTTTDISLSFDHIEIFTAIRESTIPVMTAIGHTKDCKDSLLINEVSDINCHTPTSAATHLNMKISSICRKLYDSYIKTYNNIVSNLLYENDIQLNNVLNKEKYSLNQRLIRLKSIYNKKLIPSEIIDLPHNNNLIYVRRGNDIMEYELKFKRSLDINIKLLDEIRNLSLSSDINSISPIIKSYNDEIIELRNIIERNKQINQFNEKYDQSTSKDYEISLDKIDINTDIYKNILYNNRQLKYYKNTLNKLEENTVMGYNVDQPDNEEFNILKTFITIDKTTDIFNLITKLRNFII